MHAYMRAPREEKKKPPDGEDRNQLRAFWFETYADMMSDVPEIASQGLLAYF